jgi:putative signal transducing protein
MKDDNKNIIAAFSLPLILILLAIWKIVPKYIPAHIKDDLLLTVLILFFGFIFFYVIFRAPSSDIVYSSDSIDDVKDAEKYLEENGIKTYVKNISEYRNIMRYSGQPSLHVINPEDRDNALKLLRHRQPDDNLGTDRYIKYVHLYSPENDSELALLKSILDSEGINYFVKNDNFGSLEVGPRIGLYNSKTIEVRDDQYEQANELISDYFEKTKKKSEEQVDEYSLFDKIRMVLEVLVFGWLMPGRKKSKKLDD